MSADQEIKEESETGESRIARLIAGLGPQRRSFTISRATESNESRTIELSFSSEEPYSRWFGVEILDHDPSSVRLGRLRTKAALLVNHDPNDQVGVVEDAFIGPDRKGRARVRFGKSQRAEEIYRDVLDGIRALTSVAYVVHAMRLEGKQDDEDVYRAIDWEPYEISIVSVPVDTTVGVGRSHERAGKQPRADHEKKEKKMEANTQEAAPDIKVVQDQAREQELARVRAIVATGRQFGLEALAEEYVRSGKSVSEFSERVLEELRAKQARGVKDTHEIGMSEREVQQYSLMRAIAAAARGDWRHAGFERECHDAVAQKIGMQPQNGGFFVPFDVQSRLFIGRRDLGTSSGAAGGYLVATDNLAGSFIDLLRSRTKVVQLGARTLPGLQGNVTIPKQSAASTAYWISTEGGAITESQPSFGQLALTPRHVGAYVEITKQLMIQSNPAADRLVMDDIAAVLARAIDKVALNGSGASGEPTGVLNTSGIGSVSGTSLNWAGIVEFETDVASADADVENMAFLTTPAVRGLLKARERTGSTVGNYVWGGTTGENRLNGYRAEVSTQVPSATMIFGDWSQIIIAEWGTLEIAVNPYAQFTAGGIGVRGWATVDIGVRYPQAFSAATSIT